MSIEGFNPPGIPPQSHGSSDKKTLYSEKGFTLPENASHKAPSKEAIEQAMKILTPLISNESTFAKLSDKEKTSLHSLLHTLTTLSDGKAHTTFESLSAEKIPQGGKELLTTFLGLIGGLQHEGKEGDRSLAEKYLEALF